MYWDITSKILVTFKHIFGITIREANHFAKFPPYCDSGVFLIVIENLIKEVGLWFC